MIAVVFLVTDDLLKERWGTLFGQFLSTQAESKLVANAQSVAILDTDSGDPNAHLVKFDLTQPDADLVTALLKEAQELGATTRVNQTEFAISDSAG